MEYLLQDLTDWIAMHPHAFSVAVFFIAMMESLVVLGLLIPGAALLFGAGALMATGTLPIMPIMLCTIAGAIVGDFISFLLGHHYHQRLRVIWPFRRYPVLVNRGVDFFVRHGGKSVFMARFIGPLRPIVPAIAGMMNMTTTRFLLVDIFASILWAPVYILPGMVFGASLGLAAEVAGRLVVLLVVSAGFAWFSVWLIGSLIRLLQPHAGALLEKILERSRKHPLISPLAGSLLDPNHPEARGLAILSVLFFITLWLLLLITRQVLHGQFLEGIDSYILHALGNLRTPWVDHAIVFITLLGNQALLSFVLAGGCAWLVWKRYTKAAWHWLAAYVCTGLLTWTLKNTLETARPVDFHSGYSFPSAHTSMSLVVYGFLALMVARELPVQRRWLPYFTAGLLVVLIAFSRIYLGVHWFSDILAGLSLGVFWVALIGIAYDRHPAPTLPVKPLLAVTTAFFVVAGSWQTTHQFTQELEHYAPRIQSQRIALSTWLASGWEELPTYRVDLEGKNEQPMNFQWAGSLETFQALLEKQGWHSAPTLSPLDAMGWLAPKPDISTLPILPQVNNGQHQELLLVSPQLHTDNQLVVLRLWPSNMEILDSHIPVWNGSIVYLYLEQDLPLVAYLRTAAEFETPPNHLREALSQAENIALTHRSRKSTNKQLQWEGDVLLFREID
jgi:undecaprenyl-diphosphatase